MSENELYDEIKSAWEEAQVQKVRASEAVSALYDEASDVLRESDVDADASQAILSDISSIETSFVEAASAHFETLGARVRDVVDALERDEPTLRDVRSEAIRVSANVFECGVLVNDVIEGTSFDALDGDGEGSSISDDVISLLHPARLGVKVLSYKIDEVGKAFDGLIKSISTR